MGPSHSSSADRWGINVEGFNVSTLTRAFNSTHPFKSRLVTSSPTTFSHVREQLLTGNVTSSLTTVVGLSFRIAHDESVSSGVWFRKDRLETAYPWSVSVMKSHSYPYFSIDGLVGLRCNRRFYLSEHTDECNVTKGYILTTSAPDAYCVWEKLRRKIHMGDTCG